MDEKNEITDESTNEQIEKKKNSFKVKMIHRKKK